MKGLEGTDRKCQKLTQSYIRVILVSVANHILYCFKRFLLILLSATKQTSRDTKTDCKDKKLALMTKVRDINIRTDDQMNCFRIYELPNCFNQ